MKRTLYASVIAGFCAMIPGVLLANAPGTMCSLAQSGQVDCIRPDHFTYDLCQQIENVSRNNGIDPGFFARLLWQESRFDPNALSRAGAQGIAQFMPQTAKLRGLPDSYNPAQAIERSANYLGELQRTYGNAGLAAVAYNGGEGRANGFTKEGKGLASETVNYVPIITGLSAERWRDDPPKAHDFRLDGDTPFLQSCLNLAKDRRLTKLSPPGPKHKAWGVQLAFGRTKSEAKAKAKVARLRSSCRALVNQKRRTICRSNRGCRANRPTLWRALGETQKTLQPPYAAKSAAEGVRARFIRTRSIRSRLRSAALSA
jgi:hypothetical protein